MSSSVSHPQEPALPLDKPKARRKGLPRLLIVAVLGVIGLGATTWYFLSDDTPETQLRLSGRIEGYETNIGAKVPGRIETVAVREGDAVHQGQVVVQLDDAEIQAQLTGAKARVEAAQKQEEQARLQINLLESQIVEMQLSLTQAQGDTRGRVFQAEAAVAAAQAQLNEAQAGVVQAEAEYRLANINRDRYLDLVENGAVTQQQFDQAQTAYETALARLQARQSSVNAFRRLVESAQGQLVQAQTTELNPDIRAAQLQGLQTRLAQTQLQLAATQAEVTQTQAAAQEIQSRIADLNVISPIDGVVITRSVEPGTVIATGRTLITAMNPNEVYLRGFIPEGNIGKVRVGQVARIYLDSAPHQPLSARVSAIDTQASFTPENIYFPEDRVRQVFGVRITIDHPGGYAKPGMPADAEILLDERSGSTPR
ncbi:efflux RND transporter periplasmic adaptor subunit [Oscillatoria amoena NRMC-F 0135]|nr:efflux RND transporter periplasmic adaptor subunit [Desertifilum sp.]MDI9634387.1 efflux RND transporter periplasmic adaptor subunit [Geitlerinema splendidum]MDL5047069.1 efflux RND transporter periplasmic adaptor subunit [Oscillatoria amoena NRMC-F 0135]